MRAGRAYMANEQLVCRAQAAISRLKLSSLPLVLCVTHNLGGGVERHLRDLQCALDGLANILMMRPGVKHGMYLLSYEADPLAAGFALGFRDQDSLLSFLSWLEITQIHVHHLIGYPETVTEMLLRLRKPIDLTLHDHSIICGAPALTDRAGNLYTDDQLQQLAEKENQWVTGFRKIAKHADRIFLHSNAQRTLISRFFQERETLLCLPPSAASEEGMASVGAVCLENEPLRVLCLGHFTPEKGVRVLAGVSERVVYKKLPIHFTLLGDCRYRLPAIVEVLGRYEEQDLLPLMRDLSPHLVWLPNQCPETWSYTLSAAIELGLPVLASNLGVLPERLKGRPYSWLLPHDASPDEWIECLLSIRSVLQEGHPIPWVPQRAEDFYASPDGYLRGVLPAARSDLPLPVDLEQACSLALERLSPWRQWVLACLRGVAVQPWLAPLLARLPSSWSARLKRRLSR